MKTLSIYLKDNKIYLFDSKDLEIIFNFFDYKDIIDNIDNNKYSYFSKVINEYGINNVKIIKTNYLPLFNFIFLNNLANYIMDRVIDEKYEIIFEDHIEFLYENTVKISDELSIVEIYNNIFNILTNYSKESKDKVKIQNIEYPNENEHTLLKEFNEIFYYLPKEKEELKKKLEIDLIAFNYIEKGLKNKNNRYILPIYVDYENLKKKGFYNVNDYLKNWESIGYLKMIIKIHDYFVDYYNLNLKKGLHNDILTTTLFEILDSEIKTYPQNLKKSIEIGRATSGKCYFIDTIESPIPISVDIALILQGRDIYSVVTKVSKNK